MKNLKCVAVTGAMLNKAGYLRPVFLNEEERYIETGGSTFTSTVLEDLLQEEAAFLLQPPVTPPSDGYSLKRLQDLHSESSAYAFGAYVFYFSKEALSYLGKDKIKNSALSSGGIPVEIANEEWIDNFFFLIDRDNLLNNFIPAVMSLCARTIDKKLEKRIASRNARLEHLVQDENDELAVLAQVMLNITDDDPKQFQEAVRYYGAMLMLSPYANNYSVWLDFVLSSWNHALKEREYRDYWRDLSEGVYFAAEFRARANKLCELQTTRRIPSFKSSKFVDEYLGIFSHHEDMKHIAADEFAILDPLSEDFFFQIKKNSVINESEDQSPSRHPEKKIAGCLEEKFMSKDKAFYQ